MRLLVGITLFTLVAAALNGQTGPGGVGNGSKNPGLPKELISFTATPDKQSVDIHWATATETNNDYFIIEKSKDGQQFQILAIVPGEGNSTQIEQYTIIDSNPYLGISYYSLTQVDFDGATTVADIISVDIKAEEPRLVVSPNPFSGQTLNIQFEGVKVAKANAELLLADMNGQEIMHATIQLTNSKASVKVTEILASGIYFVQLTHNSSSETQQLKVN